MYDLLDQYVFFGRRNAYSLPEIQLLLGAKGYPHISPNGTVSLSIFTYEQDKPQEKELVPFGFTIKMNAKTLTYIGENLTKKTVREPDPFLSPSDLPCIIYGLSPDHLVSTESVSLYPELVSLLQLYQAAGIGQPAYAESLLQTASQYIDSSRYAEARELLLSRRNDTYSYALDATQSLVPEGFEHPRESRIPLSILRSLSQAESLFSHGNPRMGEVALIRGSEQVAEVGESFLPLVLSL